MKIIAVGWNYRGHNAEMNQKETPQNPIIFFKTVMVYLFLFLIPMIYVFSRAQRDSISPLIPCSL